MQILLILFVIFLSRSLQASILPAGYTYPLGIPAPSWAWDADAPARPASWGTTPATATAGFYYIAPQETGSVDAGNTYGYPGHARKTIPYTLPAGSVVELHGTYGASHYGGLGIQTQGTASQPVWIRGQDSTTVPTITGEWLLSGHYTILDNLKFALTTAPHGDHSRSIFLQPHTIGVNSDHFAFREMEVVGVPAGGGTVISVPSTFPSTTYTSDVVFYHVHIHHSGGRPLNFPTDDQDAHGITIQNAHRIWVLDSEFDHNAGNSVQVNSGGFAGTYTNHKTTFVYMGRINSHNEKQPGLWTKEAEDVIFSENTIHDVIGSNTSQTGSCLGTQYAPTRVWYLFNHCYAAESGWRASTDYEKAWQPGSTQYVIGNYFHNIHTVAGNFSNNSQGRASVSVVCNGATTRHFVNNTFWNIDAGFYCASYSGDPGGPNVMILKNNIIGKLDPTRGFHVWFESPISASAATIMNTLFDDTPLRIHWGTGTGGTMYSSVTDFATATGKCAGCLQGSAAFIGPSNAARIDQPATVIPNDLGAMQSTYVNFTDASRQDYRIGATSAAVNHGAAADEYATFQALYGIDIAKDLDHQLRTQGGTIDIGAYEFNSGGGAPHTCH